VRKYVGVLINQEGKLKPEERDKLKRENKLKYGLPKSFYSKIILPRPTEVKVFKIDEILNCKRDVSLGERL
jgi:hypothetical protein